MFEEPQFKPPKHKQCVWCDKPIFMGDRCVYLHHGMLGPGKKSGQPIVVDDRHTAGDEVLHELCSVPYMIQSIVDSSEEGEAVIDSLTGDMFGVPYSELLLRSGHCAACGVDLSD